MFYPLHVYMPCLVVWNLITLNYSPKLHSDMGSDGWHQTLSALGEFNDAIYISKIVTYAQHCRAVWSSIHCG